MPFSTMTFNYGRRAVNDSYRADRFAHVPGFISSALAEEIYAATRPVEVNRVKCHDPAKQFGEQHFAPEHPVGQFFTSPELQKLVLSCAEATEITACRWWTSVYGAGQFIEPHTDMAGDIQVLVCLTAPPTQPNGGHLILRPGSTGEVTLGLRPGDGILFSASTLTHRTTPLVASDEHPDPVRVVMVGRYFVS